MKNHFVKISLLLSMLALLLFSACKKETSTPDDPTISYVNLNKTYAVLPGGPPSFDSVDINGDGLCELYIQFQNIGAADTGALIFQPNSQFFQLAIGGIAPLPYAKLFSSGEATPTSDPLYRQASYVSVKSSSLRYGVISGDAYLAFRFITGAKFQYGWMKVNINNAYTEFKILEYAYSNQYETPINIGAK